MDKTTKSHLNNNFLKRFSTENGSLDGVAVNNDLDENLAVSEKNEQDTAENINDARNASVDAPTDRSALGRRLSKNGSEPNCSSVSYFLNVDEPFDLDLDKAKNAARDLYANELLDSWDKQARELSAAYPDFDLSNEVKNKTFLTLLRCGISLDLAYKALNFDAVLKSDVAKALDLFYADVRVRGARPTENGLVSGGGINIGLGARSFSRKERADIARRVENGEKIVL